MKCENQYITYDGCDGTYVTARAEPHGKILQLVAESCS